MIRKTVLRIVVLGSAAVSACWSQILPAPLDFSRSNAEGLRLYSVSGIFGYTAFDFPQTVPGSFAPASNSRQNYGGSVSGGWQRFHGRTNFSLRYTGTYTGFAGGTLSQLNRNRFGHMVTFNLSRPLFRKWTVDVSATGNDATLDQFLYQNSSLGTLAQTPATFDELAAAMSIGQVSNPQSSVLLNTSTVAASPTRAVLLGSHILTYGMQAGLSYAHSSRWTFRFGSFAMGGQHRSGGSTVGQNYLLPRSVGGQASVSIGFLATARTSLDFDITETYITSPFQKSSGTSGTVGLGRKMGRNWFLRGYVGANWIQNRTTGAGSTGQTIGGASLGFTTYGNTFVAMYTRMGYDLYLGAVSANTLLSGAWNWRRPRNNWGLYASYSRTQTNSAGLTSIWGWQGSAGITQRLPGNLFMSANYSHLSSRGVYLNFANRIIVDGVRLTIGWAPHRRGRNAAADDGN
jgi:hypothetical protein